MINPLGIVITVLYYKIAEKIKKISIFSKIPPIVIAGVMLIATLEIFDIDYDIYNESAKYLTIILIPTTIALGYPIYKNIELLKKK